MTLDLRDSRYRRKQQLSSGQVTTCFETQVRTWLRKWRPTVDGRKLIATYTRLRSIDCGAAGRNATADQVRLYVGTLLMHRQVGRSDAVIDVAVFAFLSPPSRCVSHARDNHCKVDDSCRLHYCEWPAFPCSLSILRKGYADQCMMRVQLFRSGLRGPLWA